MPIISVRDNGNNRWKRDKKTKKQRKQQGGKSYSERMRAKRFCCMFELGFLQV